MGPHVVISMEEECIELKFISHMSGCKAEFFELLIGRSTYQDPHG